MIRGRVATSKMLFYKVTAKNLHSYTNFVKTVGIRLAVIMLPSTLVDFIFSTGHSHVAL